MAAALTRDQDVCRSYPDGIISVGFGNQPDLVKLQQDVASHFGSRQFFDTEVQGQRVLRQLLAHKAVLLILNNVRKATDMRAFDVLGPRCRVLATTCDASIPRTLRGQSIPVSLFVDSDALQLLADAVGKERPSLPPEAHEIVKECGGLSLAVAQCGAMGKRYGGHWDLILDRLRAVYRDNVADHKAINEQHRSVWRAMQASVDILPPHEQRRFAELSVFVMDRPIPITEKHFMHRCRKDTFVLTGECKQGPHCTIRAENTPALVPHA